MPTEVLVLPTSENLTTAEKAAIELQLGVEPEFDGLADLVADASAACASYCGFGEIGGAYVGFGKAVLRQTERGIGGCDRIVLARSAAVTLAGTVGDYTLGVVEAGATLDTDEYELDDGGLLYRLSGDERTTWAAPVIITYTAGYTLLTQLPRDIERACILTLAEMHAQRGGNPGLRSQNNGLVAETFMTPVAGVPPQAAKLLDRWRQLSL